jgi:hypothetical protein
MGSCPVEHTAAVPPLFAVEAWRDAGGCCERCRAPAFIVAANGINHRTGFTRCIVLCEKHFKAHVET